MTRYRLAAGALSVSSWARSVLDAVTVEVYHLESPGMDRDFARWVLEHPSWDDPLPPPEMPKRTAEEQKKEAVRLRLERLRSLNEMNPPKRVHLCRATRLPVFLCSCGSCAPK